LNPQPQKAIAGVAGAPKSPTRIEKENVSGDEYVPHSIFKMKW
jgi:hypothetical protein